MAESLMYENSPLGIFGGTAQTTSYDNTYSELTQDTVQGAIDELNSKIDNLVLTLTTTLTAGSTSVSFTNSKINSDSTIDYYTTVYGVNPISASISNHTLTLEFNEQSSDIGVKVKVW